MSAYNWGGYGFAARQYSCLPNSILKDRTLRDFLNYLGWIEETKGVEICEFSDGSAIAFKGGGIYIRNQYGEWGMYEWSSPFYEK